MSHLTADEVLRRFFDEQTHIFKYIDYVGETARIDDSEVRRLNGVLKRNGLLTITYRNLKERREPYNTLQIEALLSSISDAEPVLRQRIDSINIPYDDSVDEIPPDYGNWYAELVDWLYETLAPNDTDDRDNLIERIYCILDANSPDAFPTENEDDEVNVFEIKRLINLAVDDVNRIRDCDILASLQAVAEKFDALRFMARMQHPLAEINLLRQGFILLITAFDAAVFDIAQIALRSDFFRLLAIIGKSEKLALKQLERYKSFDELRDSLIDEHLKKYYLKDLLTRLRELGAPCNTTGDERHFAEIIEIILRRNVHIHNRGIVDERFLDTNGDGNHKFNIHDLKIGDTAVIGPAYLARAKELCTDCVCALSRWTSGLQS